MRRGAHDENPSDAARRNRFMRCAIACVKAPLEADLDEDSGARSIVEHGVESREVKGNRLLAEGREACARREPQQRCVPRCRARNHERVDALVNERLGCVGRPNAELGSDLMGAAPIRVRDRDGRDNREADEGAGVEGADPADADYPEMETVPLAHRNKQLQLTETARRPIHGATEWS